MMMAPMGTKTAPKVEKRRITSRGVRIGRHALSVCCFRAEPSGGGMGRSTQQKRAALPGNKGRGRYETSDISPSARKDSALFTCCRRRARSARPSRIVFTVSHAPPHIRIRRPAHTRRAHHPHVSRRTAYGARVLGRLRLRPSSVIGHIDSSSPVRSPALSPRRPTNLERARPRAHALTSRHAPALSHSSSSPAASRAA